MAAKTKPAHVVSAPPQKWEAPECPHCGGTPITDAWAEYRASLEKDASIPEVATVVPPHGVCPGLNIEDLRRHIEKPFVYPALDGLYDLCRIDTICSSCGTVWTKKFSLVARDQ